MKSKNYILRQKNVISPCIYFLINDNEIVYVGQNINGGLERVNAHAKLGKKKFNYYTIIKCDYKNMNEIEAEYILKFEPIYNKIIPVNSKYKSLVKIKKSLKKEDIEFFNTWLLVNKIKIFWKGYVNAEKANKVL